MFDDDYDDYDPTETFSDDEFVVHNNRELRNLDAGRDDSDDYEELSCPHCGNVVLCHVHAPFVQCRKCGTKF